MANGVDAVVKLAEQLKTPVCNTYLHNDSFPKSHELWMGPLGYQVRNSNISLYITLSHIKS